MIKTESDSHPAKRAKILQAKQGDQQGQQKASVLSFDAATNSYTVKLDDASGEILQVDSSDVTPCVVFRGGGRGDHRAFFLRPLLEDENEDEADSNNN